MNALDNPVQGGGGVSQSGGSSDSGSNDSQVFPYDSPERDLDKGSSGDDMAMESQAGAQDSQSTSEETRTSTRKKAADEGETEMVELLEELEHGDLELLEQLEVVIGIDGRALQAAASHDDRALDYIMKDGSKAALDFKNIVVAFEGLVNQLEQLDERVIELMICPWNYEGRQNELVLMHLQRMSASYLTEGAEEEEAQVLEDGTVLEVGSPAAVLHTQTQHLAVGAFLGATFDVENLEISEGYFRDWIDEDPATAQQTAEQMDVELWEIEEVLSAQEKRKKKDTQKKKPKKKDTQKKKPRRRKPRSRTRNKPRRRKPRSRSRNKPRSKQPKKKSMKERLRKTLNRWLQ